MIRIGVNKTGDWTRAALTLGAAPRALHLAIDRAVLQEAQFFRKKVVEGFREQAPGGQKFKPLSEATLAIRRFTGFGGTKALIKKGDLRNSVKVAKKMTATGAEAFVGVLRSARSKDGKDLHNIAAIHEFGFGPIIIEVTPAMRRFLMAAFRAELKGFGSGPSSKGTMKNGILVIFIPPRPFIRPVAERYFDNAEAGARFAMRVALLLGGALGIPSTRVGGAVAGLSAVRPVLKIPKKSGAPGP